MILSSAILLVLLLPTLLSVLLSLSSIQNRVITVAASYATDFMGTEVSIGHIDVSMRGHLKVDDFLCRDLQGDTLLYVRHVSSPLMGFSLREKALKLGHSSVDGGQLNLVARLVDGESIMNIKQVVSLISGGGSDNPLEVAVSAVDIENFDINIKQLKSRNPKYGVDYGDMSLLGISGKVERLSVDGPNVSAAVENLSVHERSGFVIKNLTGNVEVGRGAIALERLSILTAWSDLHLNRLVLSGREWVQYRQFNQNVLLEVGISSGELSSNDVAYFAPALKDWGVKLYDIELQAEGKVNGLSLDIGNISYGVGTHIKTDLELLNASKIDSGYARFNLESFVINPTDVTTLFDSIYREQTAQQQQQREIIERLGEVTITGEAEGELNRVMFFGDVRSSKLGEVESNLKLDLKQRGKFAFGGEVNINNFNVGGLLNNHSIGRLTAKNMVEGVVGKGVVDRFKLNSLIDAVELNGYNLNGSRVDIDMSGADAEIEVKCDDPNVQLDLIGKIENYTSMISKGEKGGKNAIMELNAQIDEFNFKELGLNIRDESSHLAAKIEVAGSGFNIDDISGSLTISNAKYRFDDKVVATDKITVNMKDTKSGRIFTLNSEFADVVMNLSGSPSANFNYLKNALHPYLPALYEREGFSADQLYYSEGVEPQPANDPISAMVGQVSSSHLSLINIKLHNIAPIAQAFDSDFEASVDTKGLILFDPVNREFTVTLNSSYLERNAFLAIGLEAQLTNHGDSISLFGRSKEIFVGATKMENSSVAGGAKSNTIDLNVSFLNSADSSRAEVVTQMELLNTAAHGRELDIKLLPSIIGNATQQWSMRSQGIRVNSSGVKFDNLVVESHEQRMVVNGRASSSLNDNLNIALQNFDLSVLSTLVARVGYRVDGRTNGDVVISSALREARVEADVALDSVSVNTLKSPNLRLVAQWDSQRNQARLHLLNQQSRDTLVRGYYLPSRVMYYARLKVDSVQLNLIDPPLKGTIHNTSGYADVDVTLTGERRGAKLEGELRCYQIATTVGFTGVRYAVDEGVIEVRDNKLIAKDLTVNDKLSGGNGSSQLDLSVDLSQLNNISYELRATPQRMVVMDIKESENDLFYGRVTASGVANIKGDRNGVDMNITAETNNNSQFFMPLNNKASISQAEFITFVQPRVAVDTTNIINRKRESFQRQFVERSAGGNVNVTMALQVRPNTDVQLVIDPVVGDAVKARGEGNFNLTIAPKKNIFEMYGDYTISEGSYLFTLGSIVNKRFSINPGSTIQWSGDPLDATLDIEAVYKLKTSLQPLMADESTRAVPVDCIINLTDRLMSPDVSFGIELPSSDAEQQAVVSNLLNDQESISRQFFYLMLSNSFIAETTGTGNDLGVSATAATGFELLANQLSNWLSTSNYNVILRYRPESELAGDEIDFGFSKGWIDNRLLIELEGNYVSDNKQALSEDVSNFMGEAYVTWLIDPAGALRLRGFTQTIDRYDENQGEQETGVGIYYSESFENFKDLRQRVKARFTASPERQEKRAARKEQKQKSDEKESVEPEVIPEEIIYEDEEY